MFGEFAATDGVNTEFERGDAEETPIGIGNGLREAAFFVGSRSKAGEGAVEMRLVCGGVFAREQDGAAREPGLDCVQR